MAGLNEYNGYFPKKVLVLANCEGISGFISATLLQRFFLRRRVVDVRISFFTQEGFDSYLSEVGLRPGLIAGYDLFVVDFPLDESHARESDQAPSVIRTLVSYCRRVSWLCHEGINFSILNRTFGYYSCAGSELCSASTILNRMFGNRIATHDVEIVRPEYLVSIAEATKSDCEPVPKVARDIEMVQEAIDLAVQLNRLDLLPELCRSVAVSCEWRVDIYRFANFLNGATEELTEAAS